MVAVTPEVRGRNQVSMPINPWLAAAVLSVLVSPSALGACRTGFVERIDRITQKDECIPQGVILQQKLQRRQALRAERIRQEQDLEQQERIRAQQEIQRIQASRDKTSLSSKKQRLKQLQLNKQKLDRQRQLAQRQRRQALRAERIRRGHILEQQERIRALQATQR